jgi:hypothetical protein
VAVAANKSPAVSHPSGKSSKSDKSTKKPKVVKFTASGRVTAVDATAGTVTIKVKGGTKDVKRTTVTVTVPATARIVVNGAGRTLADVAAGFGVTVTGTHAGDMLTATRIEARGKKPVTKPSASPTPSPTPSDDVTPEPTDDPSASPEG